MFHKYRYKFLTCVVAFLCVALQASNEPQDQIWSPLLDLTNHTEVISLDFTQEGLAFVHTPTQDLKLFEGLRRLEINDALYWMNGPLVYIEKEWQIPKVDLENTLAPLVSKMKPAPTNQPFVVVLDPGHGGHDPGAVEPGLYEKDIVLDIALLLQTKLEESGVSVELTRTNDTFIALEDRPIVARQLKASVFVSIHANQATTSSASGIESFILPAANFPGTSNSRPPQYQSMTANRFDLQNLLLADALQREMIQQTGSLDRGIKRERFAVLRDAPCPAVLIEVGFISNAIDLANLQDPAWINKLITALHDGILTYHPHPTKQP